MTDQENIIRFLASIVAGTKDVETAVSTMSDETAKEVLAGIIKTDDLIWEWREIAVEGVQ